MSQYRSKVRNGDVYEGDFAYLHILLARVDGYCLVEILPKAKNLQSSLKIMRAHGFGEMRYNYNALDHAYENAGVPYR